MGLDSLYIEVAYDKASGIVSEASIVNTDEVVGFEKMEANDLVDILVVKDNVLKQKVIDYTEDFSEPLEDGSIVMYKIEAGNLIKETITPLEVVQDESATD